VTFAPGSTQVSVPLRISVDNVVENPEFFIVRPSLVSSDAGVSIHPDTSFVVIEDNSSKSGSKYNSSVVRPILSLDDFFQDRSLTGLSTLYIISIDILIQFTLAWCFLCYFQVMKYH